MKGKLIVFEGIDRSGKSTQTKLLIKKLKKLGIKYSYIHFPTKKTSYGKKISKYLKGKIKLTNEEKILLFTLDRLHYKDWINKKLKKGFYLLCDRYTGSNIAFQTANLKKETENKRVREWIIKKESVMPKPDKIILFDMPVEQSQKIMKNIGRRDVHEKNKEYQEKVRKEYLKLARMYKWKIIKNVKNNKLRKLEDIHSEVWNYLRL